MTNSVSRVALMKHSGACTNEKRKIDDVFFFPVINCTSVTNGGEFLVESKLMARIRAFQTANKLSKVESLCQY